MNGRGDCSTCPGAVPGVRCAAEPSAGRPYPVWRYCELARLEPGPWGAEIRRMTLAGPPPAPETTPAPPVAPAARQGPPPDPIGPVLAAWSCDYRVRLDPEEASGYG